MMKIFKNELIKTYRKWRTYIGFAAVAILIPLILIALKLGGGIMIDRSMQSVSRDFLMTGNLFNAWFLTHLILNSLWIHIPFLISLVAGDILAGEATSGTFRIMLIRPASRTTIFTAKLATSLFYTFTLVAFLFGLSLGLGYAMFGSGDLLVMQSGILILPESEMLWRFGVVLLLAIVSMWTVSALSLLFSSLVENAIGPIVGTMAVIISFLVMSNLQIDFFQSVRPFLFTTYINVWTKIFEDPVPWDSILSSSGALLGFSALFVTAAWWIFVRKDITS